MSHHYDAIVIGAGHNGLTAAALLARAGRRTLLLERRDQIGGLAGDEEFHPGYRTTGVLHDTAGVRDWVIDELDLESHGLERHAETPPVLVPRRQADGFMLWRDPERAAEEIEPLAPGDVAAYREYRSFLDRVAPVVRRVTDRPPPELFEPGARDLLDLARTALKLRLLGERDMMELMRAAPMPLTDWLGHQFESEALGAALAAPAIHHTVTGPRAPNSTVNLILGECLARPPVRGGPAALVRALERAARANGVEIRTGAAVERLSGNGRGVSGVLMEDGESLDADVIAASCDPKHLFLELLPREQRTREIDHSATAYRARGTAAKVNLALSGYPEFSSRPDVQASQIRIGETYDDLEKASDAAKYGQISRRPILDIHVPTLDSPDLAPDGHHVFSIIVHFAPYELEGGWDADRKEELYRRTVDRLAEYAPAIEEMIVGHQVVSPMDLHQRYGVTHGHMHHGEHAPDQLLIRPFGACARYATPFPGLFLAGSGSHPGGGLTCAPGALAADVMLAEH